jgi:HSP20 family protein
MPRTQLTRRRSPFAPLFTSRVVPPALPSLAEAIDEMNARASALMRDFFATVPEWQGLERFPTLNVSETKNEFTVTAELPGMSASDVKVDYTDGVLTIKGEKEKEETKEEDDRTYYLYERRYGSFQRSLPFPGGIDEDKITAEFKNGLLTVHLPKSEEVKTSGRTVPITEA